MNTTNDTQTHYRTCNLCEAMCGVEIKHRAGAIISIKGDKADPFSRGSICPKATALQDLHNDPDRLTQPVKRTPNGWQTISWNDAFDIVADNIHRIQKRDGNNAIGLYIGNPTVHNHGAMMLLPLLISSLNTRNRFSATSADQLPHMLACLEMFGNQILFPVPDLDCTDHFICIGGNPIASNGSVMSAPDITKRLKDIQKRGGKITVVDPRLTETAELADQYIAINPATDAYFLLALLNVIFNEELQSLGNLESFVDGLDIIKEISLRFTPEKVSALTGVSAEQITDLAKTIASGNSTAIYGRIGICTQEFGGINAWLIYVLNIVTGNLDRQGGMMFTRPAFDLPGLAVFSGDTGSFNRWQSRVSGLKEFGGELPVAAMAEEMLTPGKGQIKAMITHAGNPVLSTPDGRQLEKALSELEFMVSIDFFINETTQYADIILPPTGPLEHAHYDIVFHTMAVRNTAKYSMPLFEPRMGALHDWEIILELVTRLDSRDWRSSMSVKLRHQFIRRLGTDGLLNIALKIGPYGQKLPSLDKLDQFFEDLTLLGKPYAKVRERFLKSLRQHKVIDEVIRFSPYGTDFNPIGSGLSLAKLKQAPHGIDIGPLEPRLPERLATADKRINLAPAIFVKDMQRLNAKGLTQATINSDTHHLSLIGRRHIRSNNSWLHNSQRLVKGKSRCTAMLHPLDAAARSIKEGDTIIVASRVGELEITAELTDKIKQGVISIPHGWGHHRPGSQLAIAKKHPGVSLNDITDTQRIDALSGTAAFNAVPVTVALAINSTM